MNATVKSSAVELSHGFQSGAELAMMTLLVVVVATLVILLLFVLFRTLNRRGPKPEAADTTAADTTTVEVKTETRVEKPAKKSGGRFPWGLLRTGLIVLGLILLVIWFGPPIWRTAQKMLSNIPTPAESTSATRASRTTVKEEPVELVSVPVEEVATCDSNGGDYEEHLVSAQGRSPWLQQPDDLQRYVGFHIIGRDDVDRTYVVEYRDGTKCDGRLCGPGDTLPATRSDLRVINTGKGPFKLRCKVKNSTPETEYTAKAY